MEQEHQRNVNPVLAINLVLESKAGQSSTPLHSGRPLAVQLAQSEILLQPFGTLERIGNVIRISYSNHAGRREGEGSTIHVALRSDQPYLTLRSFVCS